MVRRLLALLLLFLLSPVFVDTLPRERTREAVEAVDFVRRQFDDFSLVSEPVSEALWQQLTCVAV